MTRSKSACKLRVNWATYYFFSFSLISTELATGTTFLQQSSKRLLKDWVSRSASDELSSQQNARKNRTMSAGLQDLCFAMSTVTPHSMAAFLGK